MAGRKTTPHHYRTKERDDPFLIEITCSRRFNGYRFEEETGFRPPLALLLEGQDVELSLDEKMDTFFAIERMWYWGVGSPTPAKMLLYETLFFELCESEVDPCYRHEDYCRWWDTYYKPRLAEVRELVRQNQEQRLAQQQEGRTSP